MALIEQFLAIVRNTFFESIRQPIMLVILVVATLAIVLANPLSAFTMEDDQRMLMDLGLATIYLAGAVLAALLSASVLTREIENKTALTVVSKPVGRPIFVLGKYVGVAGALSLATLYLALVFMIVEMHTVLQTVRDPVHVPVIIFGVGAMIVGIGTGVWVNYFYGKVFASTVLVLLTPLLALAYVFSLMFQPDFTPQPISSDFKLQLWLAVITLLIALLVLTAFAVAISTRLGQVLTLTATVGLFVLGLLSNWLFGRRIEHLEETWTERAAAQGNIQSEEIVRVINRADLAEPLTEVREVQVPTVPYSELAEGREMLDYVVSKVLYAIVPNFEVLSMTDAVTQGHMIPFSYVTKSALYGGCMIIAALSLGVILFQRREVG